MSSKLSLAVALLSDFRSKTDNCRSFVHPPLLAKRAVSRLSWSISSNVVAGQAGTGFVKEKEVKDEATKFANVDSQGSSKLVLVAGGTGGVGMQHLWLLKFTSSNVLFRM